MSKRKITLVLDEDTQEVIAALMMRHGAESEARVLADALDTYLGLSDVLKEAGPGSYLALVDPAEEVLSQLHVAPLERKP